MEKFRDYAISAIAVLLLVSSGSLFAIEPKKINLDQEVEKAAIEEIGNTRTPSIQIAISVGESVVYT